MRSASATRDRPFVQPSRFPAAEVVVDWPHRYLPAQPLNSRDAVCLLSHDEKFDIPTLVTALDGPARYVGAMGSRTTHARRVGLLRELGVPADQLARLRSPIGPDLGGRTTAETAVSILAEIISVRNGGTGTSLSELDGPVHVPHQPS